MKHLPTKCTRTPDKCSNHTVVTRVRFPRESLFGVFLRNGSTALIPVVELFFRVFEDLRNFSYLRKFLIYERKMGYFFEKLHTKCTRNAPRKSDARRPKTSLCHRTSGKEIHSSITNVMENDRQAVTLDRPYIRKESDMNKEKLYYVVNLLCR